MLSTSSSDLIAFRRLVWRFYRRQGRHQLPWRETRDPYQILVSEVMLQQTQVDRVIPKYQAFIERFPDVTALSEASFREVLSFWQGLGYNRRAKYLHEAAKQIVLGGGVFPSTSDGLLVLPGVGKYTAAAVCIFAFDERSVLIETNIRTVFLHHFFHNQQDVHDNELLPLIEEALPRRHVRDWYYALMDYGSHLKMTVGNESRRSRHYQKQSTFKGSDRQLRGIILKQLLLTPLSKKELVDQCMGGTPERVSRLLVDLLNEGLIERRGHHYSIST